MHATTFGSFPAAEILAAELDTIAEPSVSRKVSRLLQDFNTGLAQLEAVPDTTYRSRLVLLWRDDFLGRLSIHTAIDKFVRNVICTRAKPLLGDADAEPGAAADGGA